MKIITIDPLIPEGIWRLLQSHFMGMKGLLKALVILNVVGLFGILMSSSEASEVGGKRIGAEFLIAPLGGDVEPGTKMKPIAAPLLSTKIKTIVTGHIVRTTVIQTFQNPTKHWIEGMYYFPLPDDASVDQMVLKLGERKIVSVIKEKEEARKAFEKASAEGKVAGLLTQYRPNMFSTRVTNVEPGGKIDVEISFQSLAAQDGAHFTWRMPQAITPRYSPASPKTASAHDEVRPNAEQEELPPRKFFSENGDQNETEFEIIIRQPENYEALSSSSHKIIKERNASGDLVLRLASGAVPADRDFILNWSFSLNDRVTPILFEEQQGDIVYSLGYILPPLVNTSDRGKPRDVTFIIDVSGSMHGTSLEQAKAAMSTALGLLKSRDRFEIIAFNSDFYRLFGNSRRATTKNLMTARDFVQQLIADQGTEMFPALSEALDDIVDERFQRQILFLTDGAVTNEEEMFELVNTKLGAARLFTVGVGSAPNGWFMRKAAEFGRGIHIQISNLENAHSELSTLFSDMAAPTLQDISLDFGEETEAYPKVMPDLFGQRPVVFTSRRTNSNAAIHLSGTLAGGEKINLPLQPGQRALRKDIGKLWASKKIENLMDARARGRDAELVKASVLRVALSHQVMSAYTSFIAVDKTPVRVQENMAQKMALAGNLPAGTSWKKLYGPKTATPMGLLVVNGSSALLAAFLFFLFYRRYWR